MNYAEDHPQISADGFTVVFAGAESEYFVSSSPGPGLGRSALRLGSTCSDDVREPLSIRDVHQNHSWDEGASSVVHPTVSADGRRIVFDLIRPAGCSGGGDRVELWLRDTVAGSDRLLATACYNGGLSDFRGAGAVLSADGQFVFYTDTLQLPGAPLRTVRRHVDSGDECPFSFDVGTLARTYSACSADGSAVVGVKYAPPNYVVGRATGTSCVTQIDLLAQGPGAAARSADDATLSSDATRAAWTSINDYATGGMLPTWDIWVWFATLPQDWGSPPCPPNSGRECTPSPGGAGGTLVRFVVPGSAIDFDDLRPSITADGKRVFFLSRGDYAPGDPLALNPNNKSLVYAIDLDTPTWNASLISAARPLDEDVLWASPDFEGSTVAYSLLTGDFVDGHVDLKLVDVDFSGFGAGGDPRTPAHVPFTVQLDTCDVFGTDHVLASAELRQWRGAPRQVIVRFEVETDLGRVLLGGPYVQPLPTDDVYTSLTHDIPFQLGDGTPVECRVFVMDGGAVQADLARDAMAAQ